jgi:predicted nuclease of predicted toxin-antitoxin system
VWRLALDHNFNQDLWTGVLYQYREPELDVIRLSAVGLATAPDEVVLAWAAQEGRILLTHDAKTLLPLAYARVAAGLPMPGVIVVRQRGARRAVIDDLCLLLSASSPDEWDGRVERLPY